MLRYGAVVEVSDAAARQYDDVETGQLRPVIDRTYPLRDAASAHARMESGDHIGKILLLP